MDVEDKNTEPDTAPVVDHQDNLDKQVQAPDTALGHDDSGHESNMSTPELPSTPQEERSITPGEKNNEDADGLESLFHIRILIPNSDPMEIQIGGSDMVQELYHVLLERDASCTRTCFKIYYENKPLDHFTEIRNITKIKNRVIFQVVEEPYNIREARIHVRHMREILRSLDRSDSINGVDFASFTFLSAITHTEEVKRARADIKSDVDCLPPEYIQPGFKDSVPLKSLIPPAAPNTKLSALKFLAFSPYNPPPGPRKMKGDILYLYVDTMEDRRFHITCCARGFYVNSTTEDVFNPDPSSTYNRGIFHSLFDLLSELSPQFRRVFPQILKMRGEKHVYERLPTPYQTYSWIVPNIDHTQDQIRADDLTQPHRIGLEDHVPGQVRDWNEELQTTMDMPRTTFTERICRDRAKFKVHSDFLAAAIKGAMNIIDGNVLTINAMDDPKTHMFIWNNIFFSLGFDVKDHYKEMGGDAAAFAATTADLNAVKAYAALDHAKLHTLGMAIVDYKGYRLTAQSIIPAFWSAIKKNRWSTALLTLARLWVWNGKEEGKYVKLFTSYESKGIIGNDGRYYLLDLLRTFPPDVNFMEEGEVTELCQKNGFPRPFKHKLVTLRQELIDAFVDFRYMTFMRIVSSLVQKHCLENKENKENECTKEDSLKKITENAEKSEESDASKVEEDEVIKAITSVEKIFKEGANEVVEDQLKQLEIEVAKNNSNESEELSVKDMDTEELSNKVVAEATRMLGSFSSYEFDIRFNPDCYCKTITHAPEEDLEAQKKMVSSAAEFLLAQQIPLFIRDCTHQSIAPIDGTGVVEALHSRGINLRYLGKIIECAEGVVRLDYILTILKVELVSRCARHFFQSYMQDIEATQTGASIAHFLNCLIGASNHQQAASPTQDTGELHTISKKSNKKSKRKTPLIVNGWENVNINTTNKSNPSEKKSGEWRKLTQKSLWKSLAEDAKQHYGYAMQAENCDQFVEWSQAQRVSVVRRVCGLTGIQLLLKNYPLDLCKQKALSAPFSEADIFNLYPVVKHLNPRAQDAYNLYLTALNKMQNGFPRIGYELMSQAHNMMSNIYGPLHPDLALYALSQQHKAVMISERCNGIDNYETILDYINLAHYSFANMHIASSLKLLYRARYLMLVAHGDNHPVMAQIDANIGVILYSVQEYELAVKFLNHALKLYLKYDVTFCLKTALLFHVIARTHSCRGDFRTALSMEKETFNIYSRIFGEDHEKTRLSSECLRHLTKQAVSFQKRMNDVRGAAAGQGLVHFIPMNIQPPSLQNIVEMLNVFNNFIFLKIQPSSASKAASAEEVISHKEIEATSTEKSVEVFQEEALD
uniref:Clu domain-containing protein n=1 Tax=Ditylenchus dipsaci TaxID=166011 RepID=A0A915DZE8_9BILA